MKLFKYSEFIKEDLKSDLSPKLDDKYKDVKQDIIEMIEKSLKTSDQKTFGDFVSAYVKNPEDTKIEGLINDSDIYEFYLKYRNDVDEILSEVKFYDEKPSEMNVFGIYDYIIKGTNKAISEMVAKIQSEVGGSGESTGEATE